MATSTLYTVIALLALKVLVVTDGQVTNQTQPPTAPPLTRRPSTTPKPPSRRGIVLTVMKSYYTTRESAQIRSIPAIPYYDTWDGMVMGIKFSDPNIHFLSADVDYQSKSLYLYDYYLKSIAIGSEYNADLNLQNMSFEFMHAGVSKATVQVAYDWHSRTLYWVDPGFGWIMAVPGDKNRIDEDLYKIIVQDDIDKPDGIAVDPYEGLLFWSDNGATKKIESISLSGEGRTTLVTRNLKSPRALEADHWSKRLFWLDNLKEEIESVKYDGTDRRMVRRIAQSSLFDIAIYQEMAIISDISDGRIYFLNKTSGVSMFSSIRIGSETTYGIAVYSEDNQPGKELRDDCPSLGCPHLCLTSGNKNTGNRAPKCVCSEGFEYNAKNNTCAEAAGSYHKAIVLMTDTDICYGDLRSLASYSYNATCVFTTTRPEIIYQHGNYTTTAAPSTLPRQSSLQSLPPGPTPTTQRPPSTTPYPAETILYMDIDMESRILYFASAQNIYSRSLEQRTYANMKERVTATNLNISGLAYDWIDQFNLYYSTTQGYIYVKNVKDTSVRRILISPSNGIVENLVLLPHERQLAWTSTVGSQSKIEIANIPDFNQFNGLVSTLVDMRNRIKSLTYDQHTKTFYWIEGSTVYKYGPGNNATPEMIHLDAGDHAFYLQVYKNTLIVAERYQNTTLTHFKTINLLSTDLLKTVTAEGTIPNLPGVTHFKILDMSLQPPEENFCKNNNGNCEQICLTTHGGVGGGLKKVCACGYGFELQPDGRTCKSASKSGVDFLLVTDTTNAQISQVILDTSNVHALETNEPGTPKGLVYDRKRELVLFSLVEEDKVYASKVDVEGTRVFLELDFFTIPNRFAMDETTGNIYFTSSYYDYIGVITPHQTFIEIPIDELFLSDVTAIALHPGKGYMFYAVHDYAYSYIGRANMDGTNSQRLIENTDSTPIRWPDGLAIDYNRYLYVADRYYDTITRCDFNGRGCLKVFEDPMADINDIVTDGSFLYYSTKGKGLFKIDLSKSPLSATKMGTESEMGSLGSLALFRQSVTQPVADGCKDNGGKGPCSTICLPLPYGKYKCACDLGVDLKPKDQRTCSDVTQCQEFIGNAQAPESCLRYEGTWCQLQCKPGYIRKSETTNTTAYCNKLGDWEVSGDICKEALCPPVPTVNFVNSCTRQIGSTCAYTCPSGFAPTKRSAMCLEGAVWDMKDDEFCRETRCDLTSIVNGAFNASCEGKVNDICDYECDQYYQPFIVPASMTCQPSGQWSRNVTGACVAVLCPETVPNGRLAGECVDRSVGKSCGFNCNPGYANQVDEVTCTSAGKWSPSNACSPMPCAVSIKNGVFNSSCTGAYNSRCQFSCNAPYYKPAINTNSLVCGTMGQWQHGNAQINTNALCTEILCTQGIPNAKLSNNCNKTVLSNCDFTCNAGYQKNIGVTKATCMGTGLWSTNDMTACITSCPSGQFRCDNGQCIAEEKVCNKVSDCSDGSDEGPTCVNCPSTISNGRLLSCDYKVGSRCNFTCNTNYHKVDDQVVCLRGGEWHIKTPCEADVCPGQWACKSGHCIAKDKECDGTPDCADKSDEDNHCAVKCPLTILMGKLLNCDRTVGQRCNYTCSSGYSKQSDELICVQTGSWNIDRPCLLTTCPLTVPNGRVSPSCKTQHVADTCEVVCNTGFELVDENTVVKCLSTGQWSKTDVCTGITVKPQPQKQKGSAGANTGVVVGVVIGVILLLVIVAVVVGFLLYKRRLLPGRFRSSSPSAKYSTSDIAIENPGYMNANINVTDDSRNENPYDNVIDYQPGFSHFTNGGPDTQAGFENPMYKKTEEPLPEQSDITVHQDDIVLTTDSWQKEQLKGPEA